MGWQRLFQWLADDANPSSLANRLRRRRFKLLLDVAGDLLTELDRPLEIVDVGGTPRYWARMGVGGDRRFSVTTVNLLPLESTEVNISSTTGDALDLSQFADDAFDIAYSNSVIEHVGGRVEQRRMVAEMGRVGQVVMLQTPCRTFPIEPHFHFPFFALLPRRTRAWLLMHVSLGWAGRAADRREAEARVRSVQLLTRRRLVGLFPGAVTLWRERFLGLTKSFVVLSPARVDLDLTRIESSPRSVLADGLEDVHAVGPPGRHQ
jgi:hypothetical protein